VLIDQEALLQTRKEEEEEEEEETRNSIEWVNVSERTREMSSYENETRRWQRNETEREKNYYD
jgi:hypothetical protein